MSGVRSSWEIVATKSSLIMLISVSWARATSSLFHEARVPDRDADVIAEGIEELIEVLGAERAELAEAVRNHHGSQHLVIGHDRNDDRVHDPAAREVCGEPTVADRARQEDTLALGRHACPYAFRRIGIGSFEDDGVLARSEFAEQVGSVCCIWPQGQLRDIRMEHLADVLQ